MGNRLHLGVHGLGQQYGFLDYMFVQNGQPARSPVHIGQMLLLGASSQESALQAQKILEGCRLDVRFQPAHDFVGCHIIAPQYHRALGAPIRVRAGCS